MKKLILLTLFSFFNVIFSAGKKEVPTKKGVVHTLIKEAREALKEGHCRIAGSKLHQAKEILEKRRDSDKKKILLERIEKLSSQAISFCRLKK